MLRAITLTGLVALLGAALIGAFDEGAESVTSDGAVRVDYQRAIRAGNGFTATVAMEPATCEGMTISIDLEYAELIDDLAVQPEPDSESVPDGDRLVWKFEGANPAQVRISGRAADGWGPPVTGALGVECGKAYELELTTKRVP